MYGQFYVLILQKLVDIVVYNMEHDIVLLT